MNRFLNSVVAWLRAGYPDGIPPTDYFPVLALLSRRLSNDDVKLVARDLMQRGDFDHVDIGVLITQLTDELPSPTDVERVRERGNKELLDDRAPADHGRRHLVRGERYHDLPPDIEARVPDLGAEIVLYCGGGFRSALAADNLQKMGYTNVISMDGGIRDWREKGYPLTKA